MGELITHFKRLLKTKWKQSDTHNGAHSEPRSTSRSESHSETQSKSKASSVQETTSSERSSKSQVPGSRFDKGREFTEHENIQYVLPKDVQELDRLHQQHWMLKVAFQSNFEAPVEEALKKGITVLDSACGPGTWTLEMAEAYPASTFHGVDMAPVFPEQIKPGNCEFQLGNLNEKLPFPDNHFDYIHQRLVVIGLTSEGWKNALSELLRVLKPGGWIELKEVQMTLHHVGPLGENLVESWNRVFRSKGFLPDVGCDLGSFLEKNGCEEVNMTKLSIPINHSGVLGSLCWNDLRELMYSLKPVLVAGDPVTYSDENFDNAVQAVGKECTQAEAGSNWYVAYGRKPLA